MQSTHSDAIALLVESGFPATRREWAMGDTIVVPLGHPSTKNGLTTYPAVSWLVPKSNESWDFVQVSSVERTRSFRDLDSACRAAIESARAFAFVRRCTHCGGISQVTFGEQIKGSSLEYWIAIYCTGCGSQVESNGTGSLPDDLREVELKRNGAWIVSSPRPQGPKQWAALRSELDLDLAGLAALKSTLPGRIFRGTFAEARRLRTALLAKTVNAVVEEAG